MRNETFSLAVVNQRATSGFVSIVIDRRGEKRVKEREREREREGEGEDWAKRGTK